MATGVLSNSLQMGRPSQKKDTATATLVTIGNDVKALQTQTQTNGPAPMARRRDQGEGEKEEVAGRGGESGSYSFSAVPECKSFTQRVKRSHLCSNRTKDEKTESAESH